jgi:hypothetical protein
MEDTLSSKPRIWIGMGIFHHRGEEKTDPVAEASSGERFALIPWPIDE